MGKVELRICRPPLFFTAITSVRRVRRGLMMPNSVDQTSIETLRTTETPGARPGQAGQQPVRVIFLDFSKALRCRLPDGGKHCGRSATLEGNMFLASRTAWEAAVRVPTQRRGLPHPKNCVTELLHGWKGGLRFFRRAMLTHI